MGYQRDRLGSSGMFKVIVDVSRRVKRAFTDSDAEMSPEAEALAEQIAQAFIAGRFGDVHALGTPMLQAATRREGFEAMWADAAERYRPLTGFRISDFGPIELAYIPGLEEVPQDQFDSFVEIRFSSVDMPYEDEKAFTIAVVMIEQDGALQIGAIHAR